MMTFQGPDPVVLKVRDVLRAYADTSSARAAGFAPLGAGRFQDGTPFQGQHWINLRWFLSDGSNLQEPSFIMYVPTFAGMRLVGAAYSRRISHEDSTPSGIDGAPAEWHLHQACYRIPGVGLALADGVDDCLARGGTPTPRQTAMVHVWTERSPDGSFSHDNVSLPFLALGLGAPSTEALADHERAMELRELGVALAESYGFRLPYAKRLDRLAEGKPAADSLAEHRQEIGQLITELRAAEQSSDRRAYDTAAAKIIAEGAALRELYDQLAPTTEFREQLDRQYANALGMGGHHHGA